MHEMDLKGVVGKVGVHPCECERARDDEVVGRWDLRDTIDDPVYPDGAVPLLTQADLRRFVQETDVPARALDGLTQISAATSGVLEGAEVAVLDAGPSAQANRRVGSTIDQHDGTR